MKNDHPYQGDRGGRLSRWGWFVPALLIVLCSATPAFAWPSDAEWNVVLKNGTGFIDPSTDISQLDHRNFVGDTYPSSYVFYDGTYIYYRVRLDKTPEGPGGLKSFGWGWLLDTDNDASAYEFMIMVDGIEEDLQIMKNTKQTTLGDPSDQAEVMLWTEPAVNGTNWRALAADSSVNGNADYFLDWRIPYDIFLAVTGLTETSVVRYFLGSSNSTNAISVDLSAVDMYQGFSDPVTVSGTTPTTGSVRFTNSSWADITEIYPGQTLYIEATDADQNTNATTLQSVTVTITTPGGDSETVTLTESSVNSGVFRGSIATSAGSISAGDGTLQLTPIEVVTATYTDEVDANQNTNQPRTDTVTARASADIGLAKFVNTTTPAQGSNVVFIINATNYGPSGVTGLIINDVLPSGVTYVSYIGPGTYNNSTGAWTLGSLGSGLTNSLSITATVDNGSLPPTITNYANKSSANEYDPVGANNTASATIAPGGADISVAKSVDQPTANEGDAIQYTITVTNNGASNATGLKVTDLLHYDILYQADNGGGAYNSGTGVWNIGNLSNGANKTLLINGIINSGSSGTTIPNTASVTDLNQGDPVSSNDTDSASVTVGGADLGMDKIVNTPSPNVGQQVTYTLTLTNYGSNSATGIEVTDTLPSGLTYESYSASAGSYNSGTGVWDGIGALADGATATLLINATVDTGQGGQTVVNQASVSAAETDPVSSNDTDSASFTVQSVDIEVGKIVNTPYPDEGQTIQYTVTAKNNGPSAATSLKLYDLLPSGVTHTANNGGGLWSTATGIWDIGALSSGSTATLLINATVNTGTAGSVIRNTAILNSVAQEDRVSTNDSDSALITIRGIDLVVDKTVDNSTPAAGVNVTYTVTVTNNGPYDTTGVSLMDQLTSPLVYVSSNTGGFGTYTSGGANNGKWGTFNLTVGQTATLTLVATVPAGTASGTVIPNTATLETTSLRDIDAGNNAKTVNVYVGGTDVGLAKGVNDATPTVGDSITYTVTVTNYGPNSASGLVIEDVLPSGLTYESYSASAGAYNSGTGIWNSIGTLSSGSSATLLINATIDTGTDGQTLVNTAEKTGMTEADPIIANDTAIVSLVVQSADIEVVKVANTTAPYEGTNVVFTVTATNFGPHATTGLIINDVLPSGLTYQSATTSTGAYDSGTGEWNIGNLAWQAAAVMNVTALVDATSPCATPGNLTNTANRKASDVHDPNAANDSSSIAVTPQKTYEPSITFMKTVSTEWDPVNNTTNPKGIPGARMLYTSQATNFGPGMANTVVFTDPVPANTDMFVGDYGGAGSGPISFADGATASGLTYSFASLDSDADTLEFSQDGSDWSYHPTADADGYDSLARFFRVVFGGDFAASDCTNNPSFQLLFKVRIR